MAGTKKLNEFTADDKQSSIPDPIDLNGHDKRSADNTNNGQHAPLAYPTKVEAMNAVVSALAGFETQEISDFLAGLGKEKNTRKLDKSGKLDGTVAFKGVTKEDLDQLFTGAELTEEQTAKALTLFEAAVNIKSQTVEIGLQEQFETKLTEAVDEIRADLTNDTEDYLEYVAEKWLADNKVPLESSLKVAMAENFITKMTALLAEHKVILPENIDVVEDLTKRLEESDRKLAQAISTIAEQADEILGYEMNEKFIEVTEGMVMTQVEKLRTLAENIEAADANEFETKLVVLRDTLAESKSPSASKRGESALTEEVVLDEDDAKPAPTDAPQVRGYADAITRHVKN